LPALKNIMVRAGADFSAITKQAGKAKTSMAGMRASLAGSCSAMQATTMKLNRVLGTLGVTLSAAAIVAFAKSAKTAYETQIEGETKLATIMGQRMNASASEVKSIFALTSAQQKLGVVGDEVQLAGAQQLATFLNQMKSLQTLIPVMNNLIVQQNGLNATTENATTVGNLMGKAMQGQVTALRRAGITFSDAEAAAIKYGDEEQRAAVLAQIITNNVGQMNTAMAETPSGRLKQVSNVLGDIKEQFGQAVTTSLTAFLPALTGICRVLANMATLANMVAQSIANVFGRTAKSSAAVVSYGGAASDAVDGLTDSTNAAGSAAKNLSTFGFDTLQKLSTSSSSSGSGGSDVSTSGSGITDTGTAADAASESLTGLEKVLNRLKQTADSLDFSKLNTAFAGFKAALAGFNAGIGAGLSWIYDNILEPLAQWTISDALPAFLGVLSGALSLLSSVITAIAPIFSWLWDNILRPIASWTGGVIVDVLKWLAGALKDVSDWVSAHPEVAQILAITAALFLTAANAGKIFMSVAMGIGQTILAVTGIVKGIGAAIAFLTSPVGLVTAAVAALIAVIILCIAHWDEIKSFAVGCWESIKDAWNAAGDYFRGVGDRISEAWTAVTDRVKENAATAVNGIKEVFGTVKDWFEKYVTTPLTNGFKACINGVIGFFEGLANKGVDAVNVLVGALNSLHFTVPKWVPGIGGSVVGFNLPTVAHVALPRLATGAVLSGGAPFAAIVNDQPAGQTNIEGPLSTIVDAMMMALQGYDGGDVNVNAKVVFSGQLAQVARLLNPYLEAEAHRVGPHAVTGGA